MNSNFRYSFILLSIYPILKDNNVEFGYQRKGCKKHGHFKKKTNKITNEVHYEIKIEQNDNGAAKIYTLIHEFTHFINQHLDDKSITSAHKEYVADQVALYFINKYNLKDELKRSNMSKKWNIDAYSHNYLSNVKFNEKKEKIALKQINKTINLIEKHTRYCKI